MQQIKAIIIDDEPMARLLLANMLADCAADVSIVEDCPNLASGIKAIRKHNPDVVFLDIDMPGSSGLEILDFFEEEEVSFSIIFVTAYDRFAIKAFKLSAIDYLLKPIEQSELQAAIEKLKKGLQKSQLGILKENLGPSKNKKIIITTLGSIKFVELDTITHIQGDGAYTNIFLNDNTKITTSKNLKNYEVQLSDFPNFLRCHKSYIVNVNYVSEYIKAEGGQLLVNGVHKIDMSSEKLPTLLDMISDS